MPLRFLERMDRQNKAYREILGEPVVDPPPYPPDLSSKGSVQAVPSDKSKRTLAKVLPLVPHHYPNNQDMLLNVAHLIPVNSLILVTGASGFQGSHVVDQLLKRGYRVRGTVRSVEKAAWTTKLFETRYGSGRFTTIIVPDMQVKDAFHVAASTCLGIIHCASVMTLSSDPKEVIPPSIAGALNALEAAAKEPQMRRFVFCSATVAATGDRAHKPRDVTSDNWNLFAFETAWGAPSDKTDRGWDVFASSKVQTEQAVWQWYEERQPRFLLNAVLPGTLYGRVLAPRTQPLPAMLNAPLEMIGGTLAALPPHHYISVSDSAQLHVCALLLPNLHNERIFAVAGVYTSTAMHGVLAKYARVPLPSPVAIEAVDDTCFADSPHAAALLERFHGRKTAWMSLYKCLDETFQELMWFLPRASPVPEVFENATGLF
nr:nad-dependent epimerase/dehydratase terh [Quercus suber]